MVSVLVWVLDQALYVTLGSSQHTFGDIVSVLTGAWRVRAEVKSRIDGTWHDILSEVAGKRLISLAYALTRVS